MGMVLLLDGIPQRENIRWIEKIKYLLAQQYEARR